MDQNTNNLFHEFSCDSRCLYLQFEGRCEEWPREELGRKALQKKLEIFLKTFAAVKGPQQLFKHRTLLQMFVSFLSNPDSKLANLALSCVLRFKLPYLTPYAEHVQPMLQKEGLREALTKFDLSEESDMVDISHRLDLIPIVTRILFGRFLSRGNGAKSSKDSPVRFIMQRKISANIHNSLTETIPLLSFKRRRLGGQQSCLSSRALVTGTVKATTSYI